MGLGFGLGLEPLHRACGPPVVLHVTLDTVADAEAQPAQGSDEALLVGRSDHRVAAVQLHGEGRGAALVFHLHPGHGAWLPCVVLHIALDTVAWEWRGEGLGSGV